MEQGTCELAFRGTAGPWTATARRRLRIAPPGFPRTAAYSGQIDGRREIVVRLPEQFVPGSLEVSLTVFPTVLAQLRQAIDGLDRAAGGDFEHACAVEELNVLAMRYLVERRLADTDLTRRLKDALRDGCARLVGLESREGGFAMFPAGPGEPILTALAARQWHELASVYDADPAIARRTVQWLRSAAEASLPAHVGPASASVQPFLPADAAATAYIAWALSESEGPETQAEGGRTLALGSASAKSLAPLGALQTDVKAPSSWARQPTILMSWPWPPRRP